MCTILNVCNNITTLINRRTDEEELRYMEIESKLILKSQRRRRRRVGENCSRVKDVLCGGR